MERASVQKRVGRALAAKRHAAGLSQEELAEKSELHRTYISGIECGARNITVKVLEKLALSLGVPMAHLVPDAPPAQSLIHDSASHLQSAAHAAPEPPAPSKHSHFIGEPHRIVPLWMLASALYQAGLS